MNDDEHIKETIRFARNRWVNLAIFASLTPAICYWAPEVERALTPESAVVFVAVGAIGLYRLWFAQGE